MPRKMFDTAWLGVGEEGLAVGAVLRVPLVAHAA